MIKYICVYYQKKVLFMKKLISFFILTVFIFTLTSCKAKEPNHKTGWQNPEEPSLTEEITTEEEEEEITEIKNDAPVNSDKTENIDFSEKKAVKIGSFDNSIYGKLTVYLQEGYFLIFDEFQDRKFTVFAENYSVSKTDGSPVSIFEDMNFDGHTDFAVCYYKDALNSYYFCFLWNSAERSFNYYLPLSNLANPEFISENKSIIANEKLTVTKSLEKTFVYSGDTLSQVSQKEVTVEPDNTGAETVNADLKLSYQGKNAVLELKANKDTHSEWQCFIEDESVVILGSRYFDEDNSTYEFILSGITHGTTTVIFRYVSVTTDEYIEEIIINATTKEDMSVNIVFPQ